MLDAALAYAAAGVSVIPCEPVDKKPCGALVPPAKDGNRVIAPGGLHKATRDPETIAKWWTMRPDAMIGAATGSVSGFFVIDPDVPKQVSRGKIGELTPDGGAAWEQLKADHNGHAPTIEVTTPSGGRHVYFKFDPDRPLTNREGELSGTGINVRGNGGYVIMPPSCRSYPDTQGYTFNKPFDAAATAPR